MKQSLTRGLGRGATPAIGIWTVMVCSEAIPNERAGEGRPNCPDVANANQMNMEAIPNERAGEGRPR